MQEHGKSSESLHDTRMRIRRGEHEGPTAGLGRGYVQGNLVILPKEFADDFRGFCVLNPKPCPILAISNPGVSKVPALGADVDVCTDLPRYRIWREGELAEEVSDISAYWNSDFIAFVLGCSFSFEHALLESSIPLKHINQGLNVAMYRSSIATVEVGRFRGPLVVSMRPLRASDAIRAIQITTRFPIAHGAPVHIGLPELIGIKDLSRPDYGDAVEVERDEIPVFWACGVTPQAVITHARLPICITHAPGCMLITEVPISRVALM